MQDQLARLEQWGCDTKAALERMANDEAFFLSLLEELMDDPLFVQLKQALDAADVKTAFEKAHTLKGVLGNLSLMPMYAQICEIVEPLRKGTMQGVGSHYDTMMELFERLRAALHPDGEYSAEGMK